MGLGNGNSTSGNKSSGYNYEVRVLKSLDKIVQAVNNIPPAGDATAANQVVQINQQQTSSFGVSTADVLEQIQIQAQAITLNTAYLDVPLSQVGYNYSLSLTLGELLGNGSSGETTISALEDIMIRVNTIAANTAPDSFSFSTISDLLFDGTGTFLSVAQQCAFIMQAVQQTNIVVKSRSLNSNLSTKDFTAATMSALKTLIDAWRSGTGAAFYEVSTEIVIGVGTYEALITYSSI